MEVLQNQVQSNVFGQVSRVNCFDVRHFLWLFWLSVSAESVFSQYKVDFVNQCVIFFVCQLIATYLGQYVQQFVFPDHISCIFEKNFPLMLTVLETESSQNQPQGRRRRRGKYEKRGPIHYYLFSPSQPWQPRDGHIWDHVVFLHFGVLDGFFRVPQIIVCRFLSVNNGKTLLH